MITRREAERLCKSFLGDNAPPKLPENFAFEVRKMAATPHRSYFCYLLFYENNDLDLKTTVKTYKADFK